MTCSCQRPIRWWSSERAYAGPLTACHEVCCSGENAPFVPLEVTSPLLTFVKPLCVGWTIWSNQTRRNVKDVFTTRFSRHYWKSFLLIVENFKLSSFFYISFLYKPRTLLIHFLITFSYAFGLNVRDLLSDVCNFIAFSSENYHNCNFNEAQSCSDSQEIPSTSYADESS